MDAKNNVTNYDLVQGVDFEKMAPKANNVIYKNNLKYCCSNKDMGGNCNKPDIIKICKEVRK